MRSKSFFLSIALHLGLIFLLVDHSNFQPVKSNGAPIIKAYLFHVKDVAPSLELKNHLEKKQTHKKIVKKPQGLLKQVNATQFKAHHDKQSPHQLSAPKRLTQGERSRILEKLHDAISKNLVYPNQAQFLNITGITQLGFILQPQGIINHIEVLKSSGSSILDRAALATLKVVSPFQEHVPVASEFTINVQFDE